MKVNELRISNLVSITHEAKKEVAATCHLDYPSELARCHFVISHFSTDEINVFIGEEVVEFSLSEIEPIPLTDEWLEKLGGLKDEYEDVFIEVDSDSDTRLYLSMKGYIQLVESYHCPMFDYEHIRYVHQLQNLFSVLTGEELTIREETK